MDADVVVLGAGLAGVSAATAASEHGARVLVLERAPATGGSAAISGGYVWTATDLDGLRTEDSGEFQRHGHLVVEGYRDAIRWLSGYAPPLTAEQPNLHGRGHKFDIPLTQLYMTRAIAAAGGRIEVNSEVTDIAREDGGFVLSVNRDGATETVRARALVLATGGRQADPEVRRSLVAGGGLVPPLRGNAYSNGGGARIATALGGRLNIDNKGFYGHLWASGVEPIAPLDFIAFTFYQSEEGVMLDASGRRFAEETRGDHNNTTALAAHGGHALLLWSEEVQQRAGGQPFVGGSLPMDRWGISRARGGRADSAATADELISLARGWGYELDRATLDEDVVRQRLGDRRIFAADVIPAVTMTFGGVEIDSECRVLDANQKPIPGLYAVGGDASDIYHQGYAGGLCAATVTGRIAGSSAVRAARSPNTSAAASPPA
jgi:succinate dehydrogenase/fumarate reductase flavoprotein subunit